MRSRLSFSSLLFLSADYGSKPRFHMIAIGIDMSKATFHAALDDSLVQKFKNTPEGIDTFIAAIPLGHVPGDVAIGVESTGVYHLLLATTLTNAGYRIVVMNPLESYRFAAAQSLRNRKTDAGDARSIRAMVLHGVGRPFLETNDVLTLKALVSEREGLVDMLRTARQHREARSVCQTARNVDPQSASNFDPSIA